MAQKDRSTHDPKTGQKTGSVPLSGKDIPTPIPASQLVQLAEGYIPEGETAESVQKAYENFSTKGTLTLTAYPEYAENPQHRELIKFLNEVKMLDKTQHIALCDVADADQNPREMVARDNVWNALEKSGRAQIWDDATLEDAPLAMGTWEAIAALMARDLIGQYHFMQDDYDILRDRWSNVTRQNIHPDDAMIVVPVSWKGCPRCGDKNDLLVYFRNTVCGKCARENHQKVAGR
jgi:hypothetical protein